ncbi:hypothetical protein, partial [Providencia rettgeri]|uniref:hypothetical protein n=1 Tax=Providencia rettgeri TaxID=587 RepID=UPI00235DF789
PNRDQLEDEIRVQEACQTPLITLLYRIDFMCLFDFLLISINRFYVKQADSETLRAEEKTPCA